MKKIFFMALAATLTLISCSNTSKQEEKSNTESVKAEQTNDTISVSMAKVIGAQIANKAKDQIDKAAFLEACEKALFSENLQALGTEFNTLQSQMSTAKGEALKLLQSKAAGLNHGAMMNQQFASFKKDAGLHINVRKFFDTFKATLMAETVPDVTIDEAKLNAFFARLQQEMQKTASQKADANKKAGEMHLAKLKADDKAIKTTASGLSYKVLKEGTGAKVKATDVAQVKYTGSHIDGTVFDDGGGKVVEFSPNQVVKGFGEGLMLMSPGAKYRLFIPGNLGYGENGTPGGPIGPNEMLIFDVELVGVK